MSFCRIISNDASDDDGRLSRREHIPRSAEEDFGPCSAMWQIQVRDKTEEAGQGSLCKYVSIVQFPT